jgi:hypothetical protein
MLLPQVRRDFQRGEEKYVMDRYVIFNEEDDSIRQTDSQQVGKVTDRVKIARISLAYFYNLLHEQLSCNHMLQLFLEIPSVKSEGEKKLPSLSATHLQSERYTSVTISAAT